MKRHPAESQSPDQPGPAELALFAGGKAISSLSHATPARASSGAIHRRAAGDPAAAPGAGCAHQLPADRRLHGGRADARCELPTILKSGARAQRLQRTPDTLERLLPDEIDNIRCWQLTNGA